MNKNYRLAFSRMRQAVADMEVAEKESPKVLVDGNEVEGGDHFQIMDIGLVVYNAQGQSMAAFAPGNWKTCRLA